MTTRRLRLTSVPVGEPAAAAVVDLGYAVHGDLAPDGRNCIVLPTYYTGTHDSYQPWIGPGRAFDTDRWFVVVPDMIGNGVSRIHHPGSERPWDPRTDPVVRVSDNIAVQRRLLDHLGVRHVALVAGWSMGGLQAYQWALSCPDLVSAILPICASSRCWPLNAVFLEGVAPYLQHALDHPDERDFGLRSFGSAYVGWAYSDAYFRDEVWRTDGYSSVEDLRRAWGEDHLGWDPADLLTMLRTWQSADPGAPDRSWQEALSTVTARAVLMPSSTDMYFTVAANELEADCLTAAEVRPIQSSHGHIAGRPGHLDEVTEAVAAAARHLLGPLPE